MEGYLPYGNWSFLMGPSQGGISTADCLQRRMSHLTLSSPSLRVMCFSHLGHPCHLFAHCTFASRYCKTMPEAFCWSMVLPNNIFGILLGYHLTRIKNWNMKDKNYEINLWDKPSIGHLEPLLLIPTQAPYHSTIACVPSIPLPLFIPKYTNSLAN